MYGKRKRVLRRKKPASKRSVIRRAVSKAKRGMFRKAVKRVISSVAETKVCNYYYNDFGIVNTQSTAFSGTIKSLSPSASSGSMITISQGTGAGQRIGNKITVKKAILAGTVHINPTFDLTTNYNMCPLKVCLWIFQLKGGLTDDTTNVNDIVQNYFFDYGNTSIGMSGKLMDLTRPPNANYITLLKKRVFSVGTQNVVSGFGLNSPNNANQQFSSSETMSRMFRIDVTKVLRKVYRFNDTSNTTSDRQVWCMWTPFRVDGRIPDTSTGLYLGPVPAIISWSYDFYYQDE